MRMNAGKAMLAAALALLAATPGVAEAYLGPGLGMGAISVAFGIIGSIFMAIVAIVWYPFKRLLRRRRRTPAPKAGDAAADPETVE